jgi:predicted small integral membrane protein
VFWWSRMGHFCTERVVHDHFSTHITNIYIHLHNVYIWRFHTIFSSTTSNPLRTILRINTIYDSTTYVQLFMSYPLHTTYILACTRAWITMYLSLTFTMKVEGWYSIHYVSIQVSQFSLCSALFFICHHNNNTVT